MSRKLHLPLAFTLLGAGLLFPTPALAMHIADGILPGRWALLWWVISLPFIALGLRRARLDGTRDPGGKPLVWLVGALVFVISCLPVPVPIAGASSHACGVGLAAILIGPGRAVAVTSVVLFFQALLLAHGGFTTLGAGVLAMGVIGAYSAAFCFHLSKRIGLPWYIGVFSAGLVADWATYATTAFVLALSLPGEVALPTLYGSLMLSFAPTQIPLGILEGILTVGACRFVQTRRPDLVKEIWERKELA